MHRQSPFKPPLKAGRFIWFPCLPPPQISLMVFTRDAGPRTRPGGVATAARSANSSASMRRKYALDQVGEQVVADLDEAIGLEEERFDLPPAGERHRETAAGIRARRVLAARPGRLVSTDQHVLIKLAVEHDQAADRQATAPHPLRHRGLGMR